MSLELHLIDVASGWTAEVVLPEPDLELLTRQMVRCVEYGGLELFASWFSSALASSLPTLVDYDLRPPTEAQVKFAMAIARTLRVVLTPDVLRYRGAMHEFLSNHKDAFDARRRVRSSVRSGVGNETRSRGEAKADAARELETQSDPPAERT
jgi:hypothetical protein